MAVTWFKYVVLPTGHNAIHDQYADSTIVLLERLSTYRLEAPQGHMQVRTFEGNLAARMGSR
jgi:hypothetical protein